MHKIKRFCLRSACSVLVALSAGTTFVISQTPEKWIEKLASPSFHGRGYYKQGDHIAARYIESEFKRLGLEPVTGKYSQQFSHPVNTFPGRVMVKTGNKKLKPGTDYIINPGCPSVKGTYPVMRVTLPVNESDIEKWSGCFLLIDKASASDSDKVVFDSLLKYTLPVKGILVTEAVKLTWSVAASVSAHPVIHVLSNALPENFKSVSIDIRSRFIPEYTSSNVMGYVKGTSFPDSFIVFTAHYDHLGRMGKKALFAGANDNASGTAMILDLADHYSKPENRPAKSILFIAFAAEEAGLVGSRFYTDHPSFPLEAISFLINLDLMGNGQEGIMVVNGSVYPEYFGLIDSLNRSLNLFETVGIRGKARNSDHYWFSEHNVPCFFIYTMGGSKAYHDVYDVPGNLKLENFKSVEDLLKSFVAELNR